MKKTILNWFKKGRECLTKCSKEDNLFKQNMPILIATVLSWGLFLYFCSGVIVADTSSYILDESYLFLWAIFFVCQIILVPVAYIQYRRMIKNKSVKTLNKIFKIIGWFFIAVLSLPIVLPLFLGFWGPFDTAFYREINSGHSTIYNLLNSTSFYFRFFSWPDLKDILSWLLYSLPYILVMGLLYLSIRANKRLSNK